MACCLEEIQCQATDPFSKVSGAIKQDHNDDTARDIYEH